MAVEQVTCPLPGGMILGGETSRASPTHGLDTEWDSAERYGTIPTQAKDTGWGMAERCQGNSPLSGKVLAGRAYLGKNSRNTWGSAEWCQGCSVSGDLRVLAEWLSKRLI